MKHAQQILFVLLITIFSTLISCKSTKSNPADNADAKRVAAQVLAQFEAGEFSKIYQGAAPIFKQTGPEDKFVAQFQQTLKKTGTFKKQKEPSIETRSGNEFVVTYHMENDRFNSDLHLTIAKSSGGKFELAGIHEHDEPKK